MAKPEGWALTLLVVTVLILWWVKWRWPSPAVPRAHPNTKPTPRPLKSRTPDDCAREACRAAQPGLPPASITLTPYAQVKGPRGPLREKRIATAGFACPHPECLYYGITDDQIPALVGYGATVAKKISALRVSSARPAGLHLAGGAREFSVRLGNCLISPQNPFAARG
jgi:hypothetical protein